MNYPKKTYTLTLQLNASLLEKQRKRLIHFIEEKKLSINAAEVGAYLRVVRPDGTIGIGQEQGRSVPWREPLARS